MRPIPALSGRISLVIPHMAFGLANPPVTPASPHDIANNRFVSFAPNNRGAAVAMDLNTTAVLPRSLGANRTVSW